MRRLLAELPLGEVSTSMTINATAPVLLLLYELVAEEQGVAANRIRGTVQNDILKEYVARGTYIYPPSPSMRLVTDLFAYAADRLPNWNTISISGYHIREAGATAAQELAFTIANGIAYVRAAIDAGLDVDAFAPRLSFFWNGHNHFLEEIAKFRAARRMWAHLMRDTVGATDARSWAMRFHTQTSGWSLTAQDVFNNVARTCIEAMAATQGHTQSLHTNAFDEALGLPTEASATLALRTQQILAHESGMTATVDPFAGSFAMEALTDAVEGRAMELFGRIEDMGGSVVAIESGWMQSQIEEAAYAEALRQESGESVVVGVNRFTEADAVVPVMVVDPRLEAGQRERLAAWRSARDTSALERTLDDLAQAANTDTNLLPLMKEALAVGATVGEVSDVLRAAFGTYRPR
jgi:methylmalonyl-CoA mutase N-terminal domain/subunit